MSSKDRFNPYQVSLDKMDKRKAMNLKKGSRDLGGKKATWIEKSTSR